MNKRIYGLLGTIGASPYLKRAKRLNSQYARIETLYGKREYTACVDACRALFEEFISSLYVSVTGETEQMSVMLSDAAFWKCIGNKEFCDTAGMLLFACYRLVQEPENESFPGEAANLAKSGIESVIEYTARFLSLRAKKQCLDPIVLNRDDARAQIHQMVRSLRTQMDAAGCSGGMSMQPPFMNGCLLNFPESETAVWAQYLAGRLQGAGLLTSAELHTLDAREIVLDQVGMANERIRRAAADANGGALLVEHLEAFDMPCTGGNLMDRTWTTILAAAGRYRGSLCMIVSGAGEAAEQACRRAIRGRGDFPLFITLDNEQTKKTDH